MGDVEKNELGMNLAGPGQQVARTRCRDGYFLQPDGSRMMSGTGFDAGTVTVWEQPV